MTPEPNPYPRGPFTWFIMMVPGHCLCLAFYVICIFVISVIDSFGFKSKYLVLIVLLYFIFLTL